MLRSIIESLEAKSHDRQWVRHRTTGDWDERKLIEGIIGEKSIHKYRADLPPEPGSPQTKAKRLRLVVYNNVHHSDNEHFIVVISDTNFNRCGLSSKVFGKMLQSNENVQCFAMFIGSSGQLAIHLHQNLPSGKVSVYLETSPIPKVLKNYLYF